MMILSTRVAESSSRNAVVHWSAGTRNNGILRLVSDRPFASHALIFELVAIRYLLMERQVLDRVPEHGGGIRLHVSSGAIRKLLRGTSDKTDAMPYAAFIRLCLQGVEIEVLKTMWAAPVVEAAVPEDVAIDWQEYRHPHYAVDTPSMGLVYVTMHAIEKYGERNDGGKPERLLPSLIRRMKHPAITQRVLPDYVLREKAMRYGRADDVEAWSIPDQGMVFMILNNGGRRTLVTTFFRMEI